MRGGKLKGAELEELGVLADYRHSLTRADLLNGNVDLINRAIALLKDRQSYQARIELTKRPHRMARLSIVSHGLDRADVWRDNRPICSLNLSDKALTAKEIFADVDSVFESCFVNRSCSPVSA
jgi:hypothetical protein